MSERTYQTCGREFVSLIPWRQCGDCPGLDDLTMFAIGLMKGLMGGVAAGFAIGRFLGFSAVLYGLLPAIFVLGLIIWLKR